MASTPTPRPSAAAIPRPAASGERVVQGTILDFGKAKYRNDPREKPSYFVSLSTPEGTTQTLWGKDLERALNDAKLKAGDAVRLALRDRQAVDVSRDIRDEAGNVTGAQTVAGHRNTWLAERIDPADLMPPKRGPQPAGKVQGPPPAATPETPDDTVVPPFGSRFAKRAQNALAPTDVKLSATRLQEAKAEVFRQLQGLDVGIDHIEILQNGKPVCQCDFDHSKGTWSDWTEPSRDLVEGKYTPKEHASWLAEETRLRAADEARKTGKAAPAAPPREPHIAFTVQHEKRGAERILGTLPLAERRAINQAAADKAKASTKSMAETIEKASSRPTADADAVAKADTSTPEKTPEKAATATPAATPATAPKVAAPSPRERQEDHARHTVAQRQAQQVAARRQAQAQAQR